MKRALMIAAMLAAGAAQAEPAAKILFSAEPRPSAQPAASYGGYAKGCLAGAEEIAADGPGWQVMRPSRNRAWGRGEAADFVERLGAAAQAAGWPGGVLVGDVSQPRGGPMRSGHRSHQIGLDIDVWLTPAPARTLTRAEREAWGAASMVAADRRSLTAAWSPAHAQVLRAAAEDPAVARIFVNAAIKARLCAEDPAPWLRKLRPWWGHDAHFHVRLDCPAGDAGCEAQDPIPAGPGCDASLDWWFSDEALNPRPTPGAKPRVEPVLADLPAACAGVLAAPGR